MPSASLVKLVQELGARTSSGKIKWQESVEDGVFQTSFSNGSLQIVEEDLGEDVSPDYVVRIYDKNGKFLDSVSDEELKGSIQSPWSFMRDIYQEARSQALGINSTIENIIGEMETDDEIPF